MKKSMRQRFERGNKKNTGSRFVTGVVMVVLISLAYISLYVPPCLNIANWMDAIHSPLHLPQI